MWVSLFRQLLHHVANVNLCVIRTPCLYFFFFLQGTYWTIHITPEPEFSYVSFETNLSQTSYDDLVRKVVEVFKPGKFVTTLFVNQVLWLSFTRFFFFFFFISNAICHWVNSLALPPPLQSSKCRSVFSSAQKLEGYKRLDRQLAQFNDYNFVFTSYAQKHQQSWGLRMKKRRKKKGGRSGLLHPPVERFTLSSSHPVLLPLRCCRCAGSPCAGAVASPSLPSSLSCLRCCTCELDLLHESSFLCFGILAHSCCDLEVHVEELNTLCLRLSTCAAQYDGPFLQVSPLIPHRQGFRPH